ncbi:ABC transporter permease subunit, partial [Rhizobium ruizarguesonis]
RPRKESAVSPRIMPGIEIVILGIIDWTGLARAVRSKILALREEDYVQAAQLMGASTPRIIGRHLVPGFMSHLIASATI